MQLSFRDPDGFIFHSGDRIFRCVLPHAVTDSRLFLSSRAAAAWMAERCLPATRVVNGDSAWQPAAAMRHAIPAEALVLEHERIRFANYPYEWAPEMLHAAGELTLRLAREALAADFGLKDATPYNIMYEGPKPVFLDVLSFQKRQAREAVWRPYGQFVRTFVYPLLASRYFGLRLDEFFSVHRDGIEPERLVRLCPAWRLLLPPFLGAVTIPSVLSRRESESPERFRPRPARTAEEAKFLLGRLFARATHLLHRAAPRRPRADETYAGCEHSYGASEFQEKERFVADVLERLRCSAVLDIGCHTGRFSLVAARTGARVVAIDKDPAAIGTLWNTARRDNADVLPLVIDIARPPGACGWANAECPSFLDRVRGGFDGLLMLALIHHLLVNERIPLDRIFELAGDLTTRSAVVEYIDPVDPQFQRIARGREALHRDLTPGSFEAALRRHFQVVDWRQITPTRRVYVLEKRLA